MRSAHPGGKVSWWSRGAACVGEACALLGGFWPRVAELSDEVVAATPKVEVLAKVEAHCSPVEEDEEEVETSVVEDPGIEPERLEPPVQVVEPPVHDEQNLAADTSGTFLPTFSLRFVSAKTHFLCIQPLRRFDDQNKYDVRDALTDTSTGTDTQPKVWHAHGHVNAARMPKQNLPNKEPNVLNQ